MNKNIITMNYVSMCFNMPNERITSLKEYVVKFIKNKLSYNKFWALKDIKLEIDQGDVVGIIGFNGAGKSTMLKVVSGILKPTKGTVEIKGSIAPLIELGAGFDPELSGRENIYLNGAILGLSRKLMNEKIEEIIDFAELRDFIDSPVKNYSSGMYARLGFSIATCIRPDILIVDEILSVGDYRFQEKSKQRIKDMMAEGTTIIMVSHTISQVEELCNKIVWLDRGRIKKIGGKEIIAEYQH
ncbi:MAG: ABC transporter ATP-binding protein [Clostridium beijerinckii]|jgi:ABC-2 type transport system ATP-binding protein/lipopolysaccharide transport system ATP-binding protein|nr:ABC transporter ATP-binding protein [Clostridium beijerinckii]MCI1577489.1 ABC transporter ATP-binding protein [Clostridium beijerinckii]MCI1583262.1 ABC transporter ATP-binding protein [Clostridium beijerinckii]MCI1621162.1 ABC transporter ATP-binding protein [Clostridium beijerinckii]